MRIYHLNINKHLCFGCNICSVSCPLHAIQLKEKGYLTKENAVVLVKNGVAYELFEENREFNCDGCGVCQKFCPVSAIKIELVKVK